MEFNVDKCKVMCFSNRATPDNTLSYFLNGNRLQCETHSLYLGVWLSNDLSWRYHIEAKVRKASQMLGFLRRVLFQAPRGLKLIAYKSLIRPILEYGCQVWDPYKKYEIDQIEAIQRKAARFICNARGRDTSITALLKELGLEPLEERRCNFRKSLLHKTLVDACSLSPGALSYKFPELLNQGADQDKVTTRSQREAMPMNLASNRNRYHNSFLPRTIRDMKLDNIFKIAQ